MPAMTTATFRNVLSTVEENVLSRCGTISTSSGKHFGHHHHPYEHHKTSQANQHQSKSAPWGPTHSMDSDDSSAQPLIKKHPDVTQNGTDSTRDGTMSSGEHSPTRPALPVVPLPEPTTLERIFESATAAVDNFVKSASESTKRVVESGLKATPRRQLDGTTEHSPGKRALQQNADMFAVFMEDACSPCTNSALDDPMADTAAASNSLKASTQSPKNDENKHSGLGISPLLSPKEMSKVQVSEIPVVRSPTIGSVETPASRRRRRHRERQRRAESASRSSSGVPIKTLTVTREDANDIERSISELTMKSSYGEAIAQLADSRRMAYYAVGKHHKNSGRGGNRRCYFSGKLILGGAPFYAGSVQQGLRTLVVFCLPSAIGLPKGVELHRQESISTNAESVITRESSIGVVALPRTLKRETTLKSRPPTVSASSINAGSSRLSSSLDDMTLSLEEDLDPNWGLDRDYLLHILPEPSHSILKEMETRYPDQFETLPVQVKSPHCWRLFVKFCFFSGLPIAEGEMHYKVLDHIAQDVYGEEIVLSHEVMEAVNGDSAEILRLPNQKTFKYLRKHYTQQSGKLSEKVFERTSWEVVLPEV